jgi:hypothetical protein
MSNVCKRIHVRLAEADESSSKTDESLQLLTHISGGVPLRKALDRALLLPMHTAHPPPCVQMTARSSSTVHCMWSCGHVAGCQILSPLHSNIYQRPSQRPCPCPYRVSCPRKRSTDLPSPPPRRGPLSVINTHPSHQHTTHRFARNRTPSKAINKTALMWRRLPPSP